MNDLSHLTMSEETKDNFSNFSANPFNSDPYCFDLQVCNVFCPDNYRTGSDKFRCYPGVNTSHSISINYDKQRDSEDYLKYL